MELNRIACGVRPKPSLGRLAATRLGKVALICLVLSQVGCSLGVMMGKMFWGDPMTDSPFKDYTKKDLGEDGKKIVVICSTPEAIKSEYGSLDIDLLSHVALRMKQNHIKVIEPHKVANYIDECGGEIDLKELAITLDADYIVQIQVDSFAYKEENSPELFRGRSSGIIDVYELVDRDLDDERKPSKKSLKKNGKKKPVAKKPSEKEQEKDKTLAKKSGKKSGKDKAGDLKLSKKSKADREVKPIFQKGFSSVYPLHRPVPSDSISPKNFRKQYMDKVSEEIAQTFSSHVTGPEI